MHTVLLTTDTASNAKQLADFLSKVNTVKSVSIDHNKKEKYNWINPSRPATDDEFEQMITECEEGGTLTLQEAQKLSTDKIKKWIKKQKAK